MDSDHDSSCPETAPMHDILQDALDVLVSNRTSITTKGDALLAIEHVLAETSDPRAVGLPQYFNALQDSFQCNVSSRIIAWAAAAASMLGTCLNKGSTDSGNQAEVEILSAQLSQSMAIIQGVALVHNPSKLFLGRRYPLEILLDLLLVSRHLGPPPTSSSTPNSPKHGTSSAPLTKSQDIPLSSIVLDTLLCILVDCIPALRVFEDLNGVQVVVKILKRAGTPREVRMKCLEFLYFYLLDETTPPGSTNDPMAINPTTPGHSSARTSSPYSFRPSNDANSQSGYSTSHSSRSSSTSSAFSVLSTSTAATSSSLHDAHSSDEPENDSTHTIVPPQPIAPGFPRPSSRNVTPPARSPSALGRGQPRSLLMLKNEVDYVPLSPKKPHSQVNRGSSGLRPKLTERSNLTSKHRGPLSEGTEGQGDTSTTSAGTDVVATPRKRPTTPSRTHPHARGLSVSSLPSAPPVVPPSRATETPRPKLHPTSILTPNPMSKLHRRTQSLADFAAESPVQGGAGPRSASSPTASVGHHHLHRGARTMEEKKEILGTMLGNVDALVEGVKKAGVWGLS